MQGKGLTALLIALALLIAGCGGGGEEDSSTQGASPQGSTTESSSTTTEGELPPEAEEEVAEGEQKATQERRKAEGARQQGDDQDATPPKVEHNDSGGGSAQFRHKGGDNSVPDYGVEASASEREEAAESLHAYLDSLAAQRWAAACTYMSASLLATVQRLPELSKEQSDLQGAGCPEILATISGDTPQSTLQAAAKADVASLRVEGDRAFLLYRGAGGEDYVMPMIREEGLWRVGSLGGTAGI